MLIKVNYDSSTGEIKGFYPDDTPYSSIPEPYIEIDEDTWKDCRNNPGQRIVDVTNKVIITGTITVTLTATEQIAALDDEYQPQFDAKALAHSKALILDAINSTSNAATIQAEYETLLSEYTTALEALE
jgi:hypothetical protein